MIVLILASVSLVLAAIPAVLFWINLRLYRPPPSPIVGRTPAVSVLIPARNEEHSIGAAVESALANKGVDLEVVVLDDHSEDATATITAEIAARDPRVRLLSAPPLPAGWCGKQHACAVLVRESLPHPILVFVDADVRLAPDGLARAVAFLEVSGADLVSGVPRQETGTFLEKLVIPLIHFVLLGFLPLGRMCASRNPAYAAGCGQLFLARREAYEKMGGHAVIRTSLHDGLTLPAAFRRAGFATDLFDATDVASCRMYRGAGELWRGLAKNATEGMAHPARIVPFTLFLLGGQVLPVVLLCGAPLWPWAALAALPAVVLLYFPPLAGIRRFRQSPLGAALHPLGVAVLTALQWYGLLRSLLGRPTAWKGRVYPH